MIDASKDLRYQAMKKISFDVINLKSSSLYQYRIDNNYKPVIGEGNHHAKLMFIGEAPGENEAKTGHPFCGASGRVLNELLASIKISRQNVYITNLVKDRPPDNRDPTPMEIALYAPYLLRQIDIIKPSCIATLGRHSMSYIMTHFGLEKELKSISKIHGQIFKINSTGIGLMYVPLYHPAVALYASSKKSELIADFKILKNFI